MSSIGIGGGFRHECVFGRQQVLARRRHAGQVRQTRPLDRCRRHGRRRRRSRGRWRPPRAPRQRASLRFLASCLRRAGDGRAAAGDRARAAGAGAGGNQIGIALDDAHALRRQSEMIGDDLRIGGVVPLPGRLRADQHRDRAVVFKPHRRSIRPIVAAGLDVGRDADAAQPPGFFRSPPAAA